MRKFIVRKDGNQTENTNEADPLSHTTRSVFFRKNASDGTSTEMEEKEEKSEKSTTEFESLGEEAPEESKEIKELFDESFHLIKNFTDSKTKLLQKHLEEEKQLTKYLNDTLHDNLLKIARIDEQLENRKKQLEIEVDEKTKNINFWLID